MHPDPRTGLFSSSLVPQATSPDLLPKGSRFKPVVTPSDVDFEKRAEREAFRVQPATDVEARFRHGGWWADRERVKVALAAANVPASRVERFNACGANCIVEFSPTLNKHRVRASYCHDRFCQPCMESRAKKVREMLEELAKGERLRFLTLTLKATDQPLNSTISRIWACFRKMREHKLWESAVDAGAAMIEITRGADGLHWHVHIHALLVGTFIDQREIADAWEKVTGDSRIVDIRAVGDHQRGVAYVAKYATKGWSRDVLEAPDALIECVLALRGRRMLVTFGRWYGRDDQLCKAEVFDWKRVGRIEVIARDAIGGQPYARACLQSLGFAVTEKNGQLLFTAGARPWSGP